MAKIIQYTSGMSNGFFVIDEGIIAVDTGSECGEDVFLDICKNHGIDPKTIKLIVITHGHVDHFMNVGAMKKLTRAPVLCHKEAERFLKNGLFPEIIGRNELGRKIIADQEVTGSPCASVPKITPDIVWSGSEYNLTPWGIDGKILHTPGHSKCSTAVAVCSCGAIVGDTIVESLETGIRGLTYFTYSLGNDEEIIKSVHTILENADLMYSGHGNPFLKAEVYGILKKESETVDE